MLLKNSPNYFKSFFNAGVAEQNMMVLLGMALEDITYLFIPLEISQLLDVQNKSEMMLIITTFL